MSTISDIKTEAVANQAVFASTLEELAATDPNLIVVTSDSRGSGKLVEFAKRFPRQLVETGIAEQNLVGVAAGLASAGKRVFAISPACFLTARSLEQIKNDVCYSDNPVTLVGISAGVSYGALGSTHHSLHDFAVLRTIHNIDVLAPADAHETAGAVHAAYNSQRPTYIRLGKKAMPSLERPDERPFKSGKADVFFDGPDVALIATGETVKEAVEAAALLRPQGIACTVVSMHTIKPFDHSVLHEVARNCGTILTVEEHSVAGGLGEACASSLLQAGIHKPFYLLGIPDENTVTGSQMEIFSHYQLDASGICATVLKQLNR